jgi:hypothetical protein
MAVKDDKDKQKSPKNEKAVKEPKETEDKVSKPPSQESPYQQFL